MKNMEKSSYSVVTCDAVTASSALKNDKNESRAMLKLYKMTEVDFDKQDLAYEFIACAAKAIAKKICSKVLQAIDENFLRGYYTNVVINNDGHVVIYKDDKLDVMLLYHPGFVYQIPKKVTESKYWNTLRGEITNEMEKIFNAHSDRVNEDDIPTRIFWYLIFA